MQIAKSARTLVALCPLLVPVMLRAASNDYVLTPIVEQGEKEIDFKSGVEQHKDMSSGTATSLGFGLGATSWWLTALYGKWKRTPGQSNAFDAMEREVPRRCRFPAGNRAPKGPIRGLQSHLRPAFPGGVGFSRLRNPLAHRMVHVTVFPRANLNRATRASRPFSMCAAQSWTCCGVCL